MSGLGVEIGTARRAVRAAGWAAVALLAGGCEPVTLRVGPVRSADAGSPADAEGRIDATPSDAAVVADADVDGGVPSDAGGPDDASSPARKCITLPEPTLAVLTSGAVPAVQLKQFACEAVATGSPGDDPHPAGSLVFGWGLSVDPDGGVVSDAENDLLMKGGQPYSIRWNGFVAQLRAFGGLDPCEAFPLYEEWPPDGGFGLPAGACRDVTPAKDVRYLRILAGDLVPSSSLRVCDNPCP